MTFRVLVTGTSDWADHEAIAQAIAQAIAGRDDATLVVGDRPAGTDALAAATAGTLGLRIEQHSVGELVLCLQCRLHGQQDDCSRCESRSSAARDAKMVDAGADICLVFLTGSRAAIGSRFAASRCARRARDTGIEVREFSTPERREQKRRASHAKAKSRRDRIRANGPAESFTTAEIGDRDGWVCGICQDTSRPVDPARTPPHPLSPSIDHIVPVSSGGPHTRANVRITHLWCNVERNASSWHSPEYMQALLAQFMDGTPIPEQLYRRDRADLHATVLAHREKQAPGSAERNRSDRLAELQQQPGRAEWREYNIAIRIAAGELAADPRHGDPDARLKSFIERFGEGDVRARVALLREQRRRREASARKRLSSQAP